ncbi:hypothetical protein [Puniceibacterium sediminis]|nr:hypothetical protein [Puniceibacterium sediminis]
MTRFLLCGVAALTLAGCAGTTSPDNGGGVGLGNYADYQARREAELLGNATGGTMLPPAGVVSSNLSENSDPAIAAAERALGQNPGEAPFDTTSSYTEPQVVTNSAGMSEENSFDAVAGERDIAADAELIARNRAQYQVIQPTALPSRSGSEGPNIVAYALSTSNPRGTPLYGRSAFKTEAGSVRACAGYASADQAQEAFLAAGGPEKDRRNLDPDGDGYACAWDPAPFRTVRRN